jgi:hypothetical protein
MFRDTDLSGNEDSDILGRKRAESNLLPPEYRTDLFAGVEPPGKTDGSAVPGREIVGGKMPESGVLPGRELQSGNTGSKVTSIVPNRFDDNVQAVSSAVEAERMILVYGDGTFEQFNLRRDNSKNPVQESDK